MDATLIHMTAQYSNAVLVAVLPHFSNFAAKMELPIPQPITVSQIARAHVVPLTWTVSAGVWLTNGYWFMFKRHGDPQHGLVCSYSAPNNFFRDGNFNDEDMPKYFGTSHMTTKEAIVLARAALLKAGFTPDLTHADQQPSFVEPAFDLDRLHGHIPYCHVRWEWPSARTPHLMKNHTSVSVYINTDSKTVVGIGSAFGADTHPPTVFIKPSVEPELEADFQKRTQANAPPSQP